METVAVAATVRGTLSPLSAPTSMSVDLRADRGGRANMSVVSLPTICLVLGMQRDRLSGR